MIRKVSEKGRGNVRSIPRVTRKGAVTSETIFEFLATEDLSMRVRLLRASWSLGFFKFDLNMASWNKYSSKKDILDE